MELLSQAQELLAIPSTADRPDELHRALEYVLDFVGTGHTVERFSSNGKPSALVYAGPSRRHFPLILNAHLDVVPAGDEQFRPRVEGSRLYARGAHDMKVAALVEALVFQEATTPVALQLVTDEEVGGRNGTLHQLENGVTADFVVIGEQSGLRLVNESKGIFTAVLRATGRSGHSAYPWNADSALLKLTTSIQNVIDKYPVPTAEAWRTTVNVARIGTSNTALNQVPADATAWLDIRYPPQDTDFTGHSLEEIAAYLESLCAPDVTVTIERLDPPHHAADDSPQVLALQRAARNQGFSGDFLRKHGAADGRFYYQRGVDAVIFGIGGDGLHGPAEYVDITTIEPYYRALTEFVSTI
ncbi:M20 family metallopeptidase [Actinocrispum wychmicini]|uniref:Succinyl-diaminopimelate desuccinylase n=1 Tax=Actinocrispum wychmicini TaxID=1213861 RepID=A0A4R2JA02_9PSEU|nr:M20 family metallopeptidase [Actinocrispum wychmicini]TCO55097.1 succinyl-diaminopimelate desuccinylase [Actinocrispum wychmicini]